MKVLDQNFPTENLIIEHEPPCCNHCAPHSIISCCDVSDPGHTTGMDTTDSATKNKHRPNKVKVDTNHPWTNLDMQLESKLKAFHEELHVEWWKDAEDDFLSPQIFLNLDQIHHLCHLMHARALVTITDLENNFKWSWMDDYGSALLLVIHNVYKPQVLSDNAIPDASITSSLLPSMHQPGTTPSAPSNPTKIIKPHVKRGTGNQHCSVCQLVGHNSEYLFPFCCTYIFNPLYRIEFTVPKEVIELSS